MKINLGKVGYVSRGAWSNAETYYPKDIVQLDGSSWEAIAENTNIQPGTNGSIWRVFAAKGDTGKAFEYSDFTPEQIAELKRPATEAAETANAAAQKAMTAAGNATNAADDANKAAENADAEAQKANKLSTSVETAEKAREAAEEKRAESETARNTNESARIKAENERKAAETSRVSAESSRQSAEQTRESNEATRKSAEQTRATNETTRQQNEQTRQTKESERQTAETKRDEAEKLRVTEFSQIKSDAETATKNANEAAKNANSVVENALVKTEQTLTDEEKMQVQTNIGVKDTVDVVGVGEKESIELTLWKDNSLRYVSIGGIGSNNAYCLSNVIKVNRGDNISVYLYSSPGVAVVSEVFNDENHTFIRGILGGEGTTSYQDFIADKDMWIEVCSTKISFVNGIYKTKIKITNGYFPTPSGGYNRILFEKAGAVFNEETGFYELNGLTDLTEDDMALIYSFGVYNGGDLKSRYVQSKLRTNLRKVNDAGNILNVEMSNAFRNCSYIEVIYLKEDTNNKSFTVTSIVGAFANCSRLRTIIGCINLINLNSVSSFDNCSRLQDVSLFNLKSSISFEKSSLLSKDSILFMIQNSAATSAITITLHADAYAMAMADEDIQAALAEKEFVSLASA